MDIISVFSILSIAVALSMDAFAVSICKGLSLQSRFKLSHALKAGIYFGLFQALMPLIGYYLGSALMQRINTEAVTGWIAFILLAFIGGKMVKEALDKDEKSVSPDMDFKTMLVLAVATSIDAMAAGVSLATPEAPQIPIFISVSIIGITTFLFSFVGVRIGNVFGCKYKSKAEMVGGVILILMAVKFLLDGYGVI